MPSVADLVDRTATSLSSLAERGEAIEDEWQYVRDLERVWRGRLAEVRAARGREAAAEPTAEAVDVACEEADRISDPHRAIDWLSTFPQVVLLALEEPS